MKTVRFCLVAVLTMLLPGLAGATETRLQSMGGGSLYYSLPDEASVFIFPSLISSFPDTTFIEGAAEWPGAEAGAAPEGDLPYQVGGTVFLDLGSKHYFGFHGGSYSTHVGDGTLTLAFDRWTQLTKDSLKITAADRELLYTGNTAINNAAQAGTLFYGRRFTGSRLGAMVSFWTDTLERTNSGKTERRYGGTLVDGRIGFGGDISKTDSFDMAIAGGYGTYGDDTLNPDGKLGTRLKADPSWNIGLDARARLKAFKGNYLVPYLTVGYGGEGVAWNVAVADAPSYSSKAFLIAAGLDLTIQPLENFFIVPGVGVSYSMVTVSGGGSAGSGTVIDASRFSLPVFGLAVEAPLADWLCLRFGMRHWMYSQSFKDSGKEEKLRTSETTFGTGLGMRFASLSMDFMLDPQFWTKGPYAVSGQALDNGMAASFAMKATW